MIYLDNAATTEIDSRVLDAMMPFLTREYSNASSAYDFADKSKIAIHDARCRVARLINANPNEIYFTSGGSESDNWALKGTVKPGNHIITSQIEHSAILNTCKYLDSLGVEVTYIPVNEDGVVNIDELVNAIKPNTKLVSIMMANNEIGSIQPIKEIGEICKSNGIIFHTDAVQAVGHIKIDVKDMNVDMLSASGHKFGAPKGVGFLYIRNGIRIESLIHGGHQENGLRAGTYNTAGIAGLGMAAAIANLKLRNTQSVRERQIKLIGRLFEEFPNIVSLNGGYLDRLPNNINVSFNGISGEILLSLLSQMGIYVSTGSACMSGDKSISHVLKAIGVSEDDANNSIRITFSENTTDDEIDEFINSLKMCVKMAKEVRL